MSGLFCGCCVSGGTSFAEHHEFVSVAQPAQELSSLERSYLTQLSGFPSADGAVLLNKSQHHLPLLNPIEPLCADVLRQLAELPIEGRGHVIGTCSALTPGLEQPAFNQCI